MTTITPIDARKAVREWLEDLAGCRMPGESVKAMLRRVAIAAGLPAIRIKKFWYGETENIAWHEAEQIRLRAVERKEIRERFLDMQRRIRVEVAETQLERLNGDETAFAERRATACGLSALEIREIEEEGQRRLEFGEAAYRLDRGA